MSEEIYGCEGRILRERYRLLNVIGKGSFGKVYRASDLTVDGAMWAIKEIREGTLSQEERLEAVHLYRKEVEILKTLNHTGVPKVYESFSEGNCHYLVMEYVEGTTIEEICQQEPCDPKRMMAWLYRLCDILEYLHQFKPSPVIFRDLKPSNIMVTPRGRVLLIDFGIARYFCPQKPKDTHILGTPGFSPPEQYGSQQSDPRSDIYSLGATFYHILTGEDLAQFHFVFPPLSRFYPGAPKDLEMILARCLERLPEKRFQTIAEFRRALKLAENRITSAASPAPSPGGFATQPLQGQAGGSLVSPRKPPHPFLEFLKEIPAAVYLWAGFTAFLMLSTHHENLTFSLVFMAFLAALLVATLAGIYHLAKRNKFLHAAIMLASLFFIYLFFMSQFPGTADLLSKKASAGSAACEENLRNLAAAIELYAADTKGRYPDDLSKLKGRFKEGLPACPSAGSKEYAYEVGRGPAAYTIWCSGSAHEAAGVKPGFPQYSSVRGLRDGK
ncbi:MAG: serine/threonine-protein kinase [Candidatus Eremiobacteraeota bacterium]|nr:serine/threonine-protein kinase [Candidatus Eremiobacteraeota bacterium]